MITTRSKTKLKLWTLLLLNQSNLWPSETKQWFHHYWCWTKLSITDMHCTIRVRTQCWKFEVGSLLISSRDEGYRQFYWTRFFYSPPSTEVVESERGNSVRLSVYSKTGTESPNEQGNCWTKHCEIIFFVKKWSKPKSLSHPLYSDI